MERKTFLEPGMLGGANETEIWFRCFETTDGGTTEKGIALSEVRSTSSTGGQKGVKLERHDLIPVGPLQELAVHFGRGARKYDDHQWRVGYEWSKSYSAMMRHQALFWQGFDYDVCSNDPEGCAIKTVDGHVIPIHHHRSEYIVAHVSDIIESVRFDGRLYEPEPGTVGPDTCYNHTGSHHMVAVAWHSFVLLEFKDRFPEFDDRYIPKE